MRALTVHPVFAMRIVTGFKTDYRGDILITSSSKKYKGTIPGHVLGVVTLADCVPFKEEHLVGAEIDTMPFDCYAWILENPRIIKPIPMKGKLSLWRCSLDISDLEFLPVPQTPEEDKELDRIYWEPLCV